MPWKKLFAIVAAAAIWGASWQRRKIIFVIDYMPVVQALNKGASRTRRMMQLIRALHFYGARYHSSTAPSTSPALTTASLTNSPACMM